MNNSKIYKLFIDAIRSVHPKALIPKFITVRSDGILIADKLILLQSVNNLYVIACGKAAAAMANAAEEILGDKLTSGICITKHGHGLPLKKIEVIEAGHPYPDNHSYRASKTIINNYGHLNENDVVLFLLSGGASSLMSEILDNCNAEDITTLNKVLVNSGASIDEINIVRRHLSKLKGGQLSKLIYPASVHSLIISDVPGNELQDIGSGPTAADPTTFDDALNVLHNRSLLTKTPASVLKYLLDGQNGLIDDTVKKNSYYLSKTFNTIIGNNDIAVEAAALSAYNAGFTTIQKGEAISGDAIETSRKISKALLSYSGKLPCCFIWGGETTVSVTGKGKGGRSQHLALSILREMKTSWTKPNKFTILCGGTDGTDGPTEAAGAITHEGMLTEKHITVETIDSYLSEFNSNSFFKEFGTLLLTGPTQTNVMDIVIGILE